MLFVGIDLVMLLAIYARRLWVFLEHTALLSSTVHGFSRGVGFQQVNAIAVVLMVDNRSPHNASVENELETGSGEDHCVQMKPVQVFIGQIAVLSHWNFAKTHISACYFLSSLIKGLLRTNQVG